ncbi:Na+/H+ antiporter NhaC family protein [Halopelagius longus]|uniref:Na+/H+ antiporter NhaC family protein n=1 Tax=Halopelagius longus TaxID=1236180 RepID=A0A1H1AZB0_9EURY|nr:Na+/H+ antiporter NhaC family protein [Halopelagius longus]RDI70575.1 Na+/H+ antiporter NhaC family protein [Halopelagius longus]SDQ44997.1 transporter, NhaC family [Halopelagius longus]
MTDSDETRDLRFRGGRLASAVPIAFFVAWAIVQSGLLGIGDTTGLIVGMLLGLIFGMFLVVGNWKGYADVVFDGMTERVAATAIVAWLWAGMFAQTIQAGGFVDGLVWAADAISVGAALFPALTFLLAALLATGIGTGYGTAIAFTALVFPAGVVLGASPVLMFGAILSGAVFGDNLAPVSDTTIVSAVTQNADIGGVVASRLKYALVAAAFAFVAYLVAGSAMARQPIDAGNVGGPSTALGLVHLLSIAVVIVTAVQGRHIIEAVSWGLLISVALNLLLGLATPAEMVAFEASRASGLVQTMDAIPVVGAFVVPVEPGNTAVSGSLYTGASDFFPLIVLVLLIVAGAEVMQVGGAFEAIQTFLLERVATTVRRAETTMVLGTALVNAMITINTAAEIAIAPYIKTLGRRFNINGYRRANILDANTSALGYIFPWGGGLLAGYTSMTGLPEQYEWFTQSMLVNPASVWPYVFHGWFLVAVFLFAAWTGYGREYVSDRESKEVSRV